MEKPDPNRTRPWVTDELLYINGVLLAYRATSPAASDIHVWMPCSERKSEGARLSGREPVRLDTILYTGIPVNMPLRMRIGEHGM